MKEQRDIRPLGIASGVCLSTEQWEMLQALEAHDMWFVAERLEGKGILSPERIPPAIREFKRYMALIGLGYRGLTMGSPEVDEVWHAFVLFTREYAQFCRGVFGEFIHHVPETSRTKLASGGKARFAAAYQAVFGPLPDLWGEAARPAPVPALVGAAVSGCGEGECTEG